MSSHHWLPKNEEKWIIRKKMGRPALEIGTFPAIVVISCVTKPCREFRNFNYFCLKKIDKNRAGQFLQLLTMRLTAVNCVM